MYGWSPKYDAIQKTYLLSFVWELYEYGIKYVFTISNSLDFLCLKGFLEVSNRLEEP